MRLVNVFQTIRSLRSRDKFQISNMKIITSVYHAAVIHICLSLTLTSSACAAQDENSSCIEQSINSFSFIFLIPIRY